ncbi:hypothetical protein V6N11_039229 [Hibiscus sabdariffa]|uniref:Rho-GAP domain-containing protein n=1 Tax=Hibiscus sabdariffa TaxID=183260 RepID=A0ABR2SN68_9ROSI
MKYSSMVEKNLKKMTLSFLFIRHEQGKTDFSSGEDGHVIADCVKYIIRELSSPLVPASCCNALLEACRTEHGSRVNAMRAAVLDTFPEPNRRLLQRILVMMRIVASHKNENLMSTSAVAACMAPLLLRPLLSGECEIATDFDVGADSSMQLLQAAAAANHAQTIVITLMEEYDHMFGEGSISSDMYTDTDDNATGSEEEADDDESYDEDESYEDDDATEGSCVSNDDDDDYDDDDDASETGSENDHSVTNDRDMEKDSDSSSSSSESSESADEVKATKTLSSSIHNLPTENDDSKTRKDHQCSKSTSTDIKMSAELSKGIHDQTNLEDTLAHQNQTPPNQQSTVVGSGPGQRARRNAVWGRTAAKKNLSMETIDITFEEESFFRIAYNDAIPTKSCMHLLKHSFMLRMKQSILFSMHYLIRPFFRIETETLEAEKSDLQLREETGGDAKLEASMEKRKKALQVRCLSLEEDVARLKEEVQRERDKRTALESGLNSSQEPRFLPDKIDEKTKADLKDIAQAEADVVNLKIKVEDLEMQLKQQLEKNYASVNDSCNQRQPNHTEISFLTLFDYTCSCFTLYIEWISQRVLKLLFKGSGSKDQRSQTANEVLEKRKAVVQIEMCLAQTKVQELANLQEIEKNVEDQTLANSPN